MNQPKKERFKTSVGGQALMEGIMMRGRTAPLRPRSTL